MDTVKSKIRPLPISRAYYLSISEEINFDVLESDFACRNISVGIGNLNLEGRLLCPHGTSTEQAIKILYTEFKGIVEGLSEGLEIRGIKNMNKTRNIPSAQEVLTPNTDKALDLIAQAISLIAAERQGEKISVGPATELYVVPRSDEYSFEICFQNNRENEMCIKHMNFDTVNKVLYDKGWKVEPSKYIPEQRDNPCTIKLVLRADL